MQLSEYKKLKFVKEIKIFICFSRLIGRMREVYLVYFPINLI